MTLLDALAAALRDRLLAGHAAALPGVGTLRRERVTARVEPQADGSSLLLPPSETIAFVPGPAPDDDALANGLMQALGTPDLDPRATLRQAVDQLEAHLAASGTVPLRGVGTMRRTDSGMAFQGAPDLLAAVSRPYEGLAPVSTQASDDTVLRVPVAPPAAPTEASFIDEDTLDDDLDDVLATPLETTPDSGGLRAVFPPPPRLENRDPEPDAQAPPPVPEPRPEEPLPPAASAPTSDSPDDTNEWPVLSDPPTHHETPTPEPEPTSLSPDELAPITASPEPASPDLEWLEAYDSESVAPEDEPPGAAADADTAWGATAAAQAAPHHETPPHLPKPAPIIAGPVEPTPKKRGVPFWVWLLLPLALLVAVFFWYRATQPSEPSEPIPTTELASEDPMASVATDSLDGTSQATVADSAELALDADVPPDTSADLLPDTEAAALDGEFPVEEMTGGAPASSTPAPRASSQPTRAAPPASSTPPSSGSSIDRPDLDGLSAADREALTGTAPIVSGRGGFSWVVLSTRDRTPADLRARQYRQAGWRVRVFETQALGATVYRLAIGQFTSREQADRLRSYLPDQVPADTWRLDLSTL